jgi:hypothetical protein
MRNADTERQGGQRRSRSYVQSFPHFRHLDLPSAASAFLAERIGPSQSTR